MPHIANTLESRMTTLNQLCEEFTQAERLAQGELARNRARFEQKLPYLGIPEAVKTFRINVTLMNLASEILEMPGLSEEALARVGRVHQSAQRYFQANQREGMAL